MRSGASSEQISRVVVSPLRRLHRRPRLIQKLLVRGDRRSLETEGESRAGFVRTVDASLELTPLEPRGGVGRVSRRGSSE